jgi:hypothetical protein
MLQRYIKNSIKKNRIPVTMLCSGHFQYIDVVAQKIHSSYNVMFETFLINRCWNSGYKVIAWTKKIFC